MEKTTQSKEWVPIQRMLLADPPPFVTAKSWVVADGHTGEVIFGRCEAEKREIASLTKIMTAYAALSLTQRYQVDLALAKVQIAAKASSLCGTTASLEEGDILSLHDLLYGMMLPSGNDAAQSIAEFCGQLIRNNLRRPEPTDCEEVEEPPPLPSAHKLFVREMNNLAEQLGLGETWYANPHGLMNFNNRSSARDIARLSSTAMRDPLFRTIIKCRRYTCKGLDYTGTEKVFKWKNTNKLLAKGYNGVKTGVTFAAGPCLATSIERDGLFLIVVILGSKTMDQRWVEVKKLTKWAIARINKIDEITKRELALDKTRVLQSLIHV